MNGGYQDDWTGCNLSKLISRINVELCSIPNTRKNLFSFTIQPYIWIIDGHTSSPWPFHPLFIGIQRSNVSSFYQYFVKNKKLFSSLWVYCFCEKLQIFHSDRSERCRECIENSWKEPISSTAQSLSGWKIKRCKDRFNAGSPLSTFPHLPRPFSISRQINSPLSLYSAAYSENERTKGSHAKTSHLVSKSGNFRVLGSTFTVSRVAHN